MPQVLRNLERNYVKTKYDDVSNVWENFVVMTTSSIEVITPAIVLKISGMLEGKDLNFFTFKTNCINGGKF